MLKVLNRFSKDFLLRFASVSITAVVGKVLVIPILASILTQEQFGSMMTLVGIESIISLVIGNSLYSVRLISNSYYKKNEQYGDFSFIAIIGILISGLLAIPLLFLFSELTSLDKGLLIPYVMLGTALSYYTVYYAVNMRFKEGLIYSIVAVIGLLIGLLFSSFTNSWIICYISSYCVSLSWIAITTPIIKEKVVVTKFFRMTIRKYSLVGIATLLSSALVYIDRLVLYPMIGASTVATYIAASYFGKSISIIVSPISSVMLSYYSQDSYKMDLKKLFAMNLVSIGALLMIVVLIATIGDVITKLFFPTLIEAATPYIFVASFSSGIAAITQLIIPIALKYAKLQWQTFLQLFYALIYLLGGVYLLSEYGLFAFCMLVLVLNVFLFIMYDIVCYISIKYYGKEI